MKRNRKRYRRKVFFYCSFAFCALFVLSGWYAKRIERIKALLQGYTVTDTYLPCTVTLIGYGSNTASTLITFSTPQGRITGSHERSWYGKELRMSAYFFPTPNGYIIFPYRIFSTIERKKKQGLFLFNYYTVNDFPALYDDSLMTAEQKAALQELFLFIKRIPQIMQLFGDLQLKTAIINRNETPAEYSLFVSAKGFLQFHETEPLRAY